MIQRDNSIDKTYSIRLYAPEHMWITEQFIAFLRAVSNEDRDSLWKFAMGELTIRYDVDTGSLIFDDYKPETQNF